MSDDPLEQLFAAFQAGLNDEDLIKSNIVCDMFIKAALKLKDKGRKISIDSPTKENLVDRSLVQIWGANFDEFLTELVPIIIESVGRISDRMVATIIDEVQETVDAANLMVDIFEHHMNSEHGIQLENVYEEMHWETPGHEDCKGEGPYVRVMMPDGSTLDTSSVDITSTVDVTVIDTCLEHNLSKDMNAFMVAIDTGNPYASTRATVLAFKPKEGTCQASNCYADLAQLMTQRTLHEQGY
jgi:hypothetical protein